MWDILRAAVRKTVDLTRRVEADLQVMLAQRLLVLAQRLLVLCSTADAWRPHLQAEHDKLSQLPLPPQEAAAEPDARDEIFGDDDEEPDEATQRALLADEIKSAKVGEDMRQLARRCG